jgi:hypothetical protein
MKNQVKEANQNNKRKAVIAVASATALIAIIVLAIILPILRANADFDRIFEKMRTIEEPELVITDMGAENVFGNNKGEVRVTSTDLVKQLAALSENFKYSGKDSDSMGSWDIRVRVKTADGWIEIYLDDDNMYYLSRGNYYRFVPENEEIEKEYTEILVNVRKLLEK